MIKTQVTDTDATSRSTRPGSRTKTAAVIDASLRFVRSNPELLAFAYSKSRELDMAADDLLLDAIARVRISRRRGGVELGDLMAAVQP